MGLCPVAERILPALSGACSNSCQHVDNARCATVLSGFALQTIFDQRDLCRPCNTVAHDDVLSPVQEAVGSGTIARRHHENREGGDVTLPVDAKTLCAFNGIVYERSVIH